MVRPEQVLAVAYGYLSRSKIREGGLMHNVTLVFDKPEGEKVTMAELKRALKKAMADEEEQKQKQTAP
jgi:hypothetical protein